MLKRWRSPFLKKEEFEGLKGNLISFLKGKEVIVFVPENTGPNWLGVKNATFSMYPDNTFVLPQSYSNPLLNPSQLSKLKNILVESEIRLIIFSGTPPYIFDWIETDLKAKNIQLGLIFHGGLAELAYSETNRETMERSIKLCSEGVISRIGIVKEGLDKWFSEKTNREAFRILPSIDIPNNLKTLNLDPSKTHIGVFGNSSYNKNRHMQVAAASQIKNAIIHIFEPNEFSYCTEDENIVVHKGLNRTEFLSLLGSMDINLYCSFSESWGQVIIESLALGIPCIYSNNSGISSMIESDQLQLNDYDNVEALTQKIKEVLNDKEFSVNFDINLFQAKVSALNEAFIQIS